VGLFGIEHEQGGAKQRIKHGRRAYGIDGGLCRIVLDPIRTGRAGRSWKRFQSIIDPTLLGGLSIPYNLRIRMPPITLLRPEGLEAFQQRDPNFKSGFRGNPGAALFVCLENPR